MQLRVHIEKIFLKNLLADLSEFNSSGPDELHPSLLKEWVKVTVEVLIFEN